MSPTRMSYTDAAEDTLRRFGKGAPLHYRRITELAIDHELIAPGGLTPEASMNASINQEIKRRERQGEEQRFKAVGRGMYALAEPIGPLGGAVDIRNDEVKERLRKVLSEIDPQAFESLVGELLIALGFENVVVTRYSADGGIDVTGDLVVGGITDVHTAIQVKRWANNVPGRTVRELRGALGPHEQGLIVTLSDFTTDAQAEAQAANRTPISLVNGDRFVDLLMEHEIGVTRRRVSIYELDEGAFLQIDDPGEEDPETVADDAHAPPPRRLTLRTQKSLSVWPLPGGNAAWKQTLDQMLRYVAANAPTVEEAVSWLVETYERVSSEKVARGYWQVARSFGLLETSGEHLNVTVDGAEYLDSPTPTKLVPLIEKHTAGFTEILDLLRRVGTATNEELLQHLRETLGVTWQTDAQIRFRMGWLENLGLVAQRKDRWILLSGGVEEPDAV